MKTTMMERLNLLRQSGFTNAQAESVLRIVEETSEVSLLREWMLETFASKADLTRWQAQFAAETAERQAEFAAETAERQAELRADLTRWQAQFAAETAERQAELRTWSADTLASKTDLSGVRLEISGVRLEIAEVKADLVKWVAGFFLSSLGLTLAGVYFILTHFRP